jgi:hypothetical protein
MKGLDRFKFLKNYFENLSFEYFEFLALGPFTSGFGLNAFESCYKPSFSFELK